MDDIMWGDPMTGPQIKALDLPKDTPCLWHDTQETVGFWDLDDKSRLFRLPTDHWFYKGFNSIEVSPKNNDYNTLQSILNEAYEQAANGKGKERHANGKPWEKQPIAEIGRMVGVGFNTGQAIKKLQESSRMEPDAACRELLGAIVYAASAIMLIREDGGE